MDTVASWRLLSPPPCPQQLPKRQATFAASPQQHSTSSSSAKFRLLCHLHLHDKVDSHIATNLALVSLPLPPHPYRSRLQFLPPAVSDRPCSLFCFPFASWTRRRTRSQRRRCSRARSCRGWQRCYSAAPSGQLYVQECRSLPGPAAWFDNAAGRNRTCDIANAV